MNVSSKGGPNWLAILPLVVLLLVAGVAALAVDRLWLAGLLLLAPLCMFADALFLRGRRKRGPA